MSPSKRPAGEVWRVLCCKSFSSSGNSRCHSPLVAFPAAVRTRGGSGGGRRRVLRASGSRCTTGARFEFISHSRYTKAVRGAVGRGMSRAHRWILMLKNDFSSVYLRITIPPRIPCHTISVNTLFLGGLCSLELKLILNRTK